jgi:hypothetical protein
MPGHVPGIFYSSFWIAVIQTPAILRRTAMTHKYFVGQHVHFIPGFSSASARGTYKVVGHLPVEHDDRRRYRIKSLAETFDRTADEGQLTGPE